MGISIENPSSGIDFIQDTKPANPASSGKLWLRTTDFLLFAYDQPNNRWISTAKMHVDFTNPPGVAPGAGGTQFARVHGHNMNNTGLSWRFNEDILVTDASIIADQLPTDEDFFEILSDGSVVYELFWDGTNTGSRDDAVDLELEGGVASGGNRVAFRWHYGSVAPPANQALRGTIWYRWRVDGD